MEKEFDNLNVEENEETNEETNEEIDEETNEDEVEVKEEDKKTTQSTEDKFKERSKEDVVKSYTELEKKLNEKGEEIARLQKQIDGASKEKKKELKDDMADLEKEIIEEIEKADYSKMDAKEYAKFMIQKNRKIMERIAERKASDTYTKQSTFQEKIKKEINETAAAYPIIDEKSDRGQAFRDVVLDLVSASKARGQEISLKEAAKRASALIGEQPKEKKEVKKPKPLEKTQPFTPGENKTEEEQVKERIKKAGGSGMLGGL